MNFYTRNFRLVVCFIGLALLGAARLHAQASAVEAIAFNGTGTVDTTWLGNASASGSYNFVYKANGSNGTTASQSGTKPVGMTISTTVTGGGIGYVLQDLNNTFYIRRRVETYNCQGSTSWSEQIYTGPPSNRPPQVNQLSFSSDRRRGALLAVSTTVSDADGNLTLVQIDNLPAGASTWIAGTTGAGSAWSGSGTSSRTLVKSFLLNDAGTWNFRAFGTDAFSANSGYTSATIQVADTPYYDPANYHNGAAPVVEVVSGDALFATVSTFNTNPTQIRVRTAANQALAGAPLRITVQSGGGLIALTSGGATSTTLNLTTDANGLSQFYYRQPATPYLTSSIQALSGMTETIIRSYSYNASDATADADGDGLSAATEAVLGTSTSIRNTIQSDPKSLQFTVLAPQ